MASATVPPNTPTPQPENPHPGAADPHAAWFAEWQRLEDLWNGPEAPEVASMDDAPEGRRWAELFDLICHTPGKGLDAAEAQLTLALHALGDGPAEQKDEQSHVRAVRKALAAVRRTAADLRAAMRGLERGSERMTAVLAELRAGLADARLIRAGEGRG